MDAASQNNRTFVSALLPVCVYSCMFVFVCESLVSDVSGTVGVCSPLQTLEGVYVSCLYQLPLRWETFE